ncbi:MAG: hypothetical protein U9O24_02225 [Campylobacterota bacterium]|nr:hypothetical protein [Campylobacterota bacterium]
MKKLLLISLATLGLVFSGCSSKQYFEPEETYTPTNTSSTYSGNIVNISRNGATLSNSKYISKKGVSSVTLGEGYRYLNENSSYVLAGNIEGVLKIINKKTGETLRSVSLHIPIVSATIHRGMIAYILNNNTFGIYKIKQNKKIIENRSERTFAIDTRAASPMFIDSLAVMPMLDGKLIILDSAGDTENAKVIYLSSEKVFNNVVYLSRMGNTMIAATPRRLITLGENGQYEYRANISEVITSKGKVYLFTKEGDIIKLDANLNEISKKRFQYAHYATATAIGAKVFALDQKGSLIVLSSDLRKNKIYDFGEVNSPAFIVAGKLYKDGNVIELSELGYE